MGMQEQLLLQISLREELGSAFLCIGKREVRRAVRRWAAGGRSKHLLSWKVDKDTHTHTHTHTCAHTCTHVCTHTQLSLAQAFRLFGSLGSGRWSSA